MLAAGCPCGISRSSLHPAAQRTHRSRERPARTPWWRPPGYLSLRSHAAGMPWKAEWSPVDSSERCGGTVQAVACGAVVAAGDRGQSRSPLVPSGDGLREGRQRGPRGSYVFWVLVKRGVKSAVVWVFTKRRQRPFPGSPLRGAYPVCRSVRETFRPRPLSLPKPEPELDRRGDGAGVSSPPSPRCPCAPSLIRSPLSFPRCPCSPRRRGCPSWPSPPPPQLTHSPSSFSVSDRRSRRLWRPWWIRPQILRGGSPRPGWLHGPPGRAGPRGW